MTENTKTTKVYYYFKQWFCAGLSSPLFCWIIHKLLYSTLPFLVVPNIYIHLFRSFMLNVEIVNSILFKDDRHRISLNIATRCDTQQTYKNTIKPQTHLKNCFFISLLSDLYFFQKFIPKHTSYLS